MRRQLVLIVGLALATATPLCAATFTRTSIAPNQGVDALTRGVARAQVGRDVFSNPYATVTISNVDVYDRFPYVEARHFEVVSDPRWNRLVFGEMGQSLQAFDGKGSSFGALASPRGMAVDEQNQIYLADTGNDRVLVFKTSTEFGDITLTPIFAIAGLSGPYDVAYSDGGTPFSTGDDMLYVADTGKNRVAAFALEASGARLVATLGDLGSGTGHFAGPMAITVGRANGANTKDVYVADAHNGRLVHLLSDRGNLRWVSDARDGAQVVTSLDADQWGNLYAAAPQQGIVRKFNPSLEAVADLRGDLTSPRGVHIPFSNIHDHRDGTTTRVGQASALSVDDWTDDSGVRLWNLGVAIDGLGVVGGAEPSAHFTLTDRATMMIEVLDAADGHRLSTRTTALMDAGVHDLPLTADDLSGVAGAGDLMLRLTAVSSYANAPTAMAQSTFHVDGGGSVALPSQPQLLGNWPNPSRSSTRIAFLLPQTHDPRVSLAVYDAGGRRIRTFDRGFSPGLNQVMWDGADDNGHNVQSGLYFYRLSVGDANFTHRMVVVR